MKIILSVVALAALGGCAVVQPPYQSVYQQSHQSGALVDPYEWHTVPLEPARPAYSPYYAQPYVQPYYAPEPYYAPQPYYIGPPVTLGFDFIFRGGSGHGYRGGRGHGGRGWR